MIPLLSTARKPIRNEFFSIYFVAENTRLDDVPSNSGHCGVCHFDFNGGGPRNAYGVEVEAARLIYGNDTDAILSVESNDSDADGYDNLIEITDPGNFLNTPTFPGLSASNVGNVLNVDPADILAHLTPEGSTDSIPPMVVISSPNGGESFDAGTTQTVTWTAMDESGITGIQVHLSDDGGSTFKKMAVGEANDGTYDLFIPNLPGSQTVIRVVARDGAGNYGHDDTDGTLTIVALPPGVVPTTFRDMDFHGTQPHEGGILDNPDLTCVTCHGNYNPAVEMWYNWKGSMMAQAMRDPLMLATLAIAEQDAPSVGDLCLRCHSPGGWQEGHSFDTSGAMMTAKDRQGVQCDFCHRGVDPDYKPGISPVEDLVVLNDLGAIPLDYANGQFVTDPDPFRRGPYADADASHAFLASPFHTKSDFCGTCHDVSNPVFVAGAAPGEYDPNSFDAPHPDMDLRNMFPVERTFSEWTQSEYAATGVYAPQFAGDKPDGIVSTCQDCHMRDVTGKGSSEPGAPTRTDLPLHDLTGGNVFIPDILPDIWGAEVDAGRLQAGKQRAINMLQMAATMTLSRDQVGLNPTVTVTITNETGHKLPSGYPEGRRIWLNVKAYDDAMVLVYESGAYNPDTGVLNHDPDVKIYQIKPGISNRLAAIVGGTAGPSFHFVLNDTIYSDNRIPPRGYTYANFEAIQSPPVAHTYPDGQYWDETTYVLPEDASFVDATLYYQTTSKEYIEFLRDENVTNSWGDSLYNLWVAHGKAAPVAMTSDTISVFIDPTGVPAGSRYQYALDPVHPNPFNPTAMVHYELEAQGTVSINVYDVAGRLVRTLVNDSKPAGRYSATWNGRNNHGEEVSSGVYFFKMKAGRFTSVRKAVLLK